MEKPIQVQGNLVMFKLIFFFFKSRNRNKKVFTQLTDLPTVMKTYCAEAKQYCLLYMIQTERVQEVFRVNRQESQLF